MRLVFAFLAVAALAGGVGYFAARTSAPEAPLAVTPEVPPVQAPAPVAAPQPEIQPEPPPPAPAMPAARRRPAPRPFQLAAQPRPVPQPVELPPPPSVEPAAPDVSAAPPPAVAVEHNVPPPPEPNRVTLAAGTVLTVILDESLSSAVNETGDTFSASLDQPLIVDGFIIAERGARIEGRVTDSQRSGRVKGTATLALQLTRLATTDGQNVSIVTDPFQKQAEKRIGQDAAKIGAAAGIGAAIGAIAGGGKGAAIGAAIGGGSGAGGVLVTRGREAELPAETRIPFRLSQPVTLTERI